MKLIILAASYFCSVFWAQPSTHGLIAQQRPNFTGTWILDRSQSTHRSDRKYSRMLKIKDTDPEITVVSRLETDLSTTERRFTLFTDGRGETNKDENGKYRSITKWNGRQLEWRYSGVVRTTRQGPGIGEFMFLNLSVVELWELSNDGKVLSVKENANQSAPELMRQSPNNEDVFEFCWVYRRSS